MSHRVRGHDVTVAIPTIEGREAMLRRAVASVEAQIVQPKETIWVVDHARRGAAWTRNELLTQVTTPWVAWLDDDDELLPNHLAVLTAAASKGDADLYYPYPVVVGGRDPLAVTWNGRLLPRPFGVAFGQEQELHLRRVANFIPICYLVRTELARAVGGFPPAESHARPEDHLHLIRLLDAGARFQHVARRTWVYHVHGANTGGGLTDPAKRS